MDAVGSERVAVFAPFGNAADGLMLAATYPERVTALVIVNGTARAMWAPDYPEGIPESFFDSVLIGIESDAVERGFDTLSYLGPSVAEDAAFRAWWDRSGNLGATPAIAQAIWNEIFRSDVRNLLPLVRVPTLIIQRAVNPPFGGGHGRYLAKNIAGAKFV
jgi:pimeloyl-ACP methyl ester carboxylesterase